MSTSERSADVGPDPTPNNPTVLGPTTVTSTIEIGAPPHLGDAITGLVRPTPTGVSAAFLGIPYAEPPVGPQRFLAPKRARPWQGNLDATVPGATPQKRPLAENTTIPEPSIPGDDTLNLNVFTPAPGDRQAKLPVLVWIHGGAYTAGSASSPWYDGYAFNRDGVVTVSINYRLGFDGFGAIAGQPTNRALLDQIMALEWVQDNIEYFGGDPARVTVAGQSAGGGAALALASSPAAEGLFRAAISQSGAVTARSAESTRRHTMLLASYLQTAPTLQGFRSRSADAILVASDRAARKMGRSGGNPAHLIRGLLDSGLETTLGFAPTVEEGLVPEDPYDALARRGLPLLVGSVAHEFSDVGRQFGPLVKLTAAQRQLRQELGDAYPYLLSDLGAASAEPALQVGQLATSRWMRQPVLTAGDNNSADTWVYDFRLPVTEDGLTLHCAELPFVFDCLDEPTVSRNLRPGLPQATANSMHQEWVNFVTDAQLPWGTWKETRTARVWDKSGFHDGEAYRFEQALQLLD